MSFNYTPQIPHYHSSNINSSPSVLHSGSNQLPSFEHYLESNDNFKSDHTGTSLCQSAYMHGGSKHITLENQVNQLQIELIQAKTAYSTLEAAFYKLAHSVRLVDADSTTFASTSTIPPSNAQLSALEKDDYPDVKFWSRADWDNWQATSQGLGQKVKRGPVPFLEDEQGSPITEELLDTIRKTIRSVWFELAVKELLPLSWSKLIHSTRSLFHSIIEEKFPLFRLARDGWKLDLLCSMSYPSWRKNHLDAKGSLMKQSKKVKHEGDDNIEWDIQGKKRLSSLDAEAHSASKRLKVAFEPTSPIGTEPIETSLTVVTHRSVNPPSIEPTIQNPLTMVKGLILLANSSSHASPHTPRVETDTQVTVEDPIVHPSLSSHTLHHNQLEHWTTSTTTHDEPEQRLSTLVDDDTVMIDPAPRVLKDDNQHNENQSSELCLLPASGPSEKEDVPVTSLSVSRPPIVLINPLSRTKSTRLPLIKPVLPNTSTSMGPVSASESISTTPTCISGPTIPPSSHDIPDTASKKPEKMRPGPKKNGRNLCAFRWLKQVGGVGGGTGSTKEFNTYYAQLNAEKIKSYDTEAAQLERDGHWIKHGDISDGAMY